LVDVLEQTQVPAAVRAAVPEPLLGQRGVLVGVAGHPAVLELFEHPDSLRRQWDAIVDGLLRSTLHVPARPTSTRRARAFIDRISKRSLPRVDAAGAGALAESTDDLVSIRALETPAHDLVHLAALNVRHDLVLAA